MLTGNSASIDAILTRLEWLEAWVLKLENEIKTIKSTK